MSNNHPHNPYPSHYDEHDGAIPEDLRDVAAHLDELGAHDRTGVPGLEDRLFEATCDAVRGEPSLSLTGSGRRHGHRLGAGGASRRIWSPMKLAAAVAICGAGAAIWLASATWNGQNAGPGSEVARTGQIESGTMFAMADDDLDYFAALAGADDGWDPLNERLDVLRLETDAVASSVLWDLSMGGLLLTEGVTR